VRWHLYDVMGGKWGWLCGNMCLPAEHEAETYAGWRYIPEVKK
jgi:hypothetical protein